MSESEELKNMANKEIRNQVFSLIAQDGTRFIIEQVATVGRGKDSHIKILHKKISRNHAVLSISNNNLIIKDMGSSNGTSVNDEIITAEVTLIHGDQIKFDELLYTVDIRFKSESDSPAEKQNTAEINNQTNENIPDSWIEESTTAINGTRMMNVAQLEALRAAEKVISTNDSDYHQLHCFIGEANEDIIPLKLDQAKETQVWEIGRSSECDIIVKHPSVSKKHAQLIHQNGRWKVVNLVSTNGILINGQKRLSAFLSDHDKIVLGSTCLIFQGPGKAHQHAAKSNLNKKTIIITITSVALITGVILWKYLTRRP